MEGDRINLQPIAKTTTATDGSFALRVADDRALRPFVGTDSLLNVEIVASSTEGLSSHSFSRRLEESADHRQNGALLVDPDANDARRASPENVNMTLAMGSRTTSPDPSSEASEVAAPVVKSCSSELRKNLGRKWVLVGQHYSSASYVTSDFIYTAGAHSTLGVAASAGGKYGTWYRSGTNSKSSKVTENYAAMHGKGNAYRDTYYKYGKYRITCYEGYPGVASHYYQVSATSYVGGRRTRHPGTISANYCVPEPKGGSTTIHTSRAVEWTNGADLSGSIGLDLSSRTGYSSDAEVRFAYHRNRRLCGSGGYPGGHPYQLRVKYP